MKAAVYYNEIDAYCAQWLSNLMDADLIPHGDIDTRSIEDVRPDDLRGYTQCHFFAGLGGWAYALRLAGWGTRPVWTGSCPCQPFSAAGKRAGFTDERHLWPSWQHLISQCDPPVVFGEQVANATEWLGLVCGDMEGMGRAVGFNHIEAASAGSDHRRDRIFFVADTCEPGLAKRERERGILSAMGSKSKGQDAANDGRIMGYSDVIGTTPIAENVQAWKSQSCGTSIHCAVADANDVGTSEGWQQRGRQLGGFGGDPQARYSWIVGHDGKARRVEPSIRLLADGSSANLAVLRTIEDQAIQEVIGYGETTKTDPNEVLRMVRKVFRTETCWQGKPTGMRGELPPPEVLLNFLLCIGPACQAKNGRSVAKTLEETQLRIVRSMWYPSGNSCSPCEWQSAGQCADESSDALLALSFVLARHAAAYQQAARAAHASLSRIGMLRALGNAIDPRPAAAFITAYMQARSLIADQQAVTA